MSRKHEETVVSRHIEVYQSDWDFLQEHFGRASEAKLGVSVAIRQMIRKGVRDYQERIARRLDRLAQRDPPAKPLPALDQFFKQTAEDTRNGE